ncbi:MULTISPECIES: hypothetical protein [Pseudovibrio]|uniref:hypothetical protein n=1 Tax=Stappiaceae TaxID=2821832 RepID=UPI002366F69D|nr:MULTISPECIES: hypothetical protein [Pseudovibrio]MDD7911272.1 hypothetical protein [Pseudovibrio exalbescens]MDX5593041.1 hypothetical protein [Pseudovibrio sp. SPO723]
MQTPVPLINQNNIVFGTVRLTPTNDIAPNQLPSIYFMDNGGAFLRLRPLHVAGFGMFPKPARHISLYARPPGQANPSFSFSPGNTRDEVLEWMDLLNHVTVFGGIVERMPSGIYLHYQNVQGPNLPADGNALHIRDYSPGHPERSHWGHAVIRAQELIAYYNNTYPGLFAHLMNLGVNAQSPLFTVQPAIAPQVTLVTDAQYMPLDWFEGDANAQRAAMIQFISSFV